MANADFVTRITLQNQEFQNELQQCRREIERLRNSANRSANGIGDMFGGLTSKLNLTAIGFTAAASGALAFAKACINSYAETQQLQTALRGLVGDATIADSLFERLREYGVATPYDTKGLAEAAKLMMGYGINASRVMPIMEQLGDIAMGDNNKLQSLALAFSQMSAAGKVCKQDLNQMINAGFNPLQIISEQTGQSIGELFDKVSKGEITVAQITKAFKDATSEGGKFHNMARNLGDTVDGSFNAMRDAIDGARSSIGELIAPATISLVNSFANAINGLASAFQALNRSKGGFQGYTKNEVSNYEDKTKQAVDYAYSDPKKTKSRLQNAINFEEKQLNKFQREKDNADKELAYWKKKRAENEKDLYKKDKNGVTGWTKLSNAEKTSKTRAADITLTKGRIATYNAEYLQAFPDKTTSTANNTTNKGGGKSTTNKTSPQGSLKDLENQLRQAQEAASNAIGAVAYQQALETVAEIQSQIDDFKFPKGSIADLENQISKLEAKVRLEADPTTKKELEKEIKNLTFQKGKKELNIDWEYQATDISKDTNLENKSALYSIDFELPNMDELNELGKTLDNINTAAIDEMAEALNRLGQVDITSMQSINDTLMSLTKITKKEAKGMASAGTAAQMMGQSLQLLGEQGAAAKAGLIMSALGQIAVSFAQAMTSASSNWITWLAFGVSGTAMLISLVSQLQSFSQGGIINGGSTAGDQMLARVNGGEMILNGSQQKKLFNLLNSNGAIGGFNGGQVEFKINGSTLRGVLKNYDNKMSIL